ALLLAAGFATAADPVPLRLVMPHTIYAVAGVESNLYFENVVLAINPANYAFDVECEKGRQEFERWTFTPAAEDTGTYPFTLQIRDQSNAVIAEGTTSVVVLPADA